MQRVMAIVGWIVGALVACACSGQSAASPPRGVTWSDRSTTHRESGDLGTAHPILLQAASGTYGWVIACQPRRDTDGDGWVSITVGHHGEVSGDAPVPYLMYADGDEETMDSFLAEAPNGHYVAMIRGGVVWIVDTANRRRTSLSALGIDAEDDDNWALAHPAVAFSSHDEVAFRRRSDRGSEVVVLDLPTSSAQPVYMTENRIWRVYFEDSRLVVLEVPGTNGKDEEPGFPRLGTTAAERYCRGRAKSWSSDGLDKELIEEHSIPWSSKRPSKREDVRWTDGCAPDGRQALAGSTGDRYLVGLRDRGLDYGPLEWVSHVVPCASRDLAWPGEGPGQTAEACANPSTEAPESFCLLSKQALYQSTVWGLPPDRFWTAGKQLPMETDRATRETNFHEASSDLHGTGPENIWGVSRTDPPTLLHFDGRRWRRDMKALYAGVERVRAVSSTVAWAFGRNGTTLLHQNGAWQRVPFPESGTVLALWAEHADSAWATTHLGNLYRLANGRWVNVPNASGKVVHHLWGNDDRLWGTSSTGKLLALSDDGWRVVAQVIPEELRYADRLVGIDGHTDDLWLATASGRLLEYRGGQRVGHWRFADDFAGIIEVTREDAWLQSYGRVVRFRRGSSGRSD